MKSFLLFLFFVFSLFLYNGCSNANNQTRVHVCNLNAETATVSIQPDNGKIISIDNIASGKTTDYIDIPPTPGGTISCSMQSTNPKDLRFYALGGYDYLITVSAGNNPILSWQRE
jgi:hypothetical protein